MIAPAALSAAAVITQLLDGGGLAEKDALHRLAMIIQERSPTSPNPDGSAAIYLRDIRKLASDGAVPVHLGRFLNAPQVKKWLAELSPAREALSRTQAGQDAAQAAKSPLQPGAYAPATARFKRRSGLSP
ncbi:MAG TPA: hypothetical protein VEF76_03275 [Patescibacteria group bacterium]|nr:hypothetical protein [Patescibacteria group bacterium]